MNNYFFLFCFFAFYSCYNGALLDIPSFEEDRMASYYPPHSIDLKSRISDEDIKFVLLRFSDDLESVFVSNFDKMRVDFDPLSALPFPIQYYAGDSTVLVRLDDLGDFEDIKKLQQVGIIKPEIKREYSLNNINYIESQIRNGDFVDAIVTFFVGSSSEEIDTLLSSLSLSNRYAPSMPNNMRIVRFEQVEHIQEVLRMNLTYVINYNNNLDQITGTNHCQGSYASFGIFLSYLKLLD